VEDVAKILKIAKLLAAIFVARNKYLWRPPLPRPA
jgi:hypothetical protein